MQIFEALAQILSRLDAQGARAAVLAGLCGLGVEGAALHSLKGALDPGEEQRARRACELIAQRGFGHGRNLLELLDAFIGSIRI